MLLNYSYWCPEKDLTTNVNVQPVEMHWVVMQMLEGW